MPAPKLPSRYPDAYRALFLRAQSGESITIPSTEPQTLRGRLLAFGRALRKDGQHELADAVQIRVTGSTVVVEARHLSPSALEITAALAQSGPQGPVMNDDASAIFDRLAK